MDKARSPLNLRDQGLPKLRSKLRTWHIASSGLACKSFPLNTLPRRFFPNVFSLGTAIAQRGVDWTGLAQCSLSRTKQASAPSVEGPRQISLRLRQSVYLRRFAASPRMPSCV